MKIKFNLSPSIINVYEQSQLIFYFTKINVMDPDTYVVEGYGAMGSVTHDVLEIYAKDNSINVLETFELFYKKHNCDNKFGFDRKPLPRTPYLKAVSNGMSLLTNKYENVIAEETIIFPLIDNDDWEINIKGVIDVQANLKSNGDLVIMDYKTSSSVPADTDLDFKRQGLHYCYSVWRKKGIIPKAMIFEYIKINKKAEYNFTKEDLLEYEQYLKKLANDIMKKGTDIKNYDIGTVNGIFNCHKKRCETEKYNREQSNIKQPEQLVFNLRIDKGRVYIIDRLHPKLVAGLKKKFSYEVQNAHFVRMNSNWDGIQRLYSESTRSVSLGFFSALLDVLRQYCEHKCVEFRYTVDDQRWNNNYQLPMPDNLNNRKLRSYQIEAVETFIDKKIGVLQLGTGAGKTEIALEIIRRLGIKTLFLTNRKELLIQTGARMEQVFGFDIGCVYGGRTDLQDITVATVQSVARKLNDYTFSRYIDSVQLVVCDECHGVATKQFKQVLSKMPNTLYRLGLSATNFRDDGDDMLIEEQVGPIIYDLSAKRLIQMGYLMLPKIIFYRNLSYGLDGTYLDDYKNNIVENIGRNDKIIDLVNNEHNGKKIIILTKSVEHGQALSEQIPNSFHLHGSINKKVRDVDFNKFKQSNGGVMVATLSIASEGLDIPNLDIIINAGANQGDVKSTQILGRVLRKLESKKEALYLDFLDGGKYTNKHSIKRYNLFKNEGYDVELI